MDSPACLSGQVRAGMACCCMAAVSGEAAGLVGYEDEEAAAASPDICIEDSEDIWAAMPCSHLQ
jgi:hypothetical protein